ncbi:exported protein of unknown function [Acetoanaerobium sticklandii]|uniref:Uncharacterized protein n=2 Tax=Acetoanaerobium sticklandii TaxID=1511 RepID=E3PX18_ACESD|nr:exported protein of unknown function [Acetoanaerobium sticklandii]
MELMKKNNKGVSKVEVILVMILILLMGLAVFTLVVSSSDTYKNVIDEKENLSNLRIAASYIDNKIKQSDEQSSIYIKNNPINGEASIVIVQRVDNENYETWIYLSDKMLKEAYIKQNQEFTDDMSFDIASIEEFVPSINDDIMEITISGNKASDTFSKRYLKINLKSNEG